MRVAAMSDTSRRPAGVALRSGAAPVGVGCFLVLSFLSFTAFAVPPDCLVMGTRRWCAADDRRLPSDTVVYASNSAEPHPATVAGRRPVQSGPIVAPLPIERFLPGYFEPRIYRGSDREPAAAE